MEVPSRRLVARGLLSSVAVLAVALSFGCSSMRIVEMRSKPEGAAVYVNGVRKGVTNSKIQLDFGSHPRIFVQLVKSGYKPAEQIWEIEEVPEKPPTIILEEDR